MSKIKKAANEYFVRNFYGLPGVGFNYQVKYERIEQIFAAGACWMRQKIAKDFEENTIQVACLSMGEVIKRVEEFGEEEEKISECSVQETPRDDRDIWTVWEQVCADAEHERWEKLSAKGECFL